ncbi:MAG TPA: DNA repair protein RadA [Acidobacteriota bacterium]|nr:DNA repair protein RadA [Acidobacteriota bacterium]HQG91876.1 DNA repair protein RadA [Acidobacteriota bacterium]
MTKKIGTEYVCQSCGHRSAKWLGRCPGCGAWESLVEEPAPAAAGRRGGMAPAGRGDGSPRRFDEIESQDGVREPSGLPEFDRVLGGGIVPGSLVLIGGEPGVGKSTLLLQIAAALAAAGRPVLYVSGEESDRQIKLRGERLGVAAPELFVMAETALERIEQETVRMAPAALIVDSIQTVYTAALESAPGSIGQVRECAARCLTLAKSHGIPVFLIGHITKEGAIAGPKALEHIVDTVLYFEGERHLHHRVVRAVKNRFGAASEVALFEMTGRGLLAVANPSAFFLAGRHPGQAGTAVIAAIEGSRPLLVEAQALVSVSNFSAGRRMTQGFDRNRLGLLLAMMERVTGLNVLGADVYLNITGGIAVEEPAADLGAVAAVASSLRNRPLPLDAVLVGEVGLGGEIRAVPQAAARIKEAQAMGFARCYLPEGNLPVPEAPKGVEIVGVSGVNALLDVLF